MKKILNYPQKTSNGWYVGVDGGTLLYLHKDAIIRDSTKYKNESSGYYKNKKDAIKTIEKYYNSQVTNSSAK